MAVTTLSFDIAGLEIYLPLTVGGRVILATREDASDGNRLLALLGRPDATALQATPATWRLLLMAGWSGGKPLKMLCGGEALPRDLANDLLARGKELWNMYGPTETTIWSSVARLEPGTGPIALGRPIANTRFYVVDARLAAGSAGRSGRARIGGAGVAEGYWGRPDLTRERFVPDPFSTTPGRAPLPHGRPRPGARRTACSSSSAARTTRSRCAGSASSSARSTRRSPATPRSARVRRSSARTPRVSGGSSPTSSRGAARPAMPRTSRLSGTPSGSSSSVRRSTGTERRRAPSTRSTPSSRAGPGPPRRRKSPSGSTRASPGSGRCARRGSSRSAAAPASSSRGSRHPARSTGDSTSPRRRSRPSTRRSGRRNPSATACGSSAGPRTTSTECRRAPSTRS